MAHVGLDAAVPGQLPPQAPSEISVAHALRAVFAAQATRATVYNQFRGGFEALLQDGDTAAYDSLCGAIAAQFNAASAGVNESEAQLRSRGRADLADAIRLVQLQEKEHLRLASRAPRRPGRPPAAPPAGAAPSAQPPGAAQEATIQVLRKSAARGQWSWQRGGADGGQATDGPLRPGWANRGGCAADGGHLAGGCGCGLGGVAEPTEEEYTAALGEARRALQTAGIPVVPCQGSPTAAPCCQQRAD